MQVQLLVERMGQNEYIAKLGGASYRFRRNEHGHMVSEITDVGVIAKVSDPRNGSFRPYVPPEIVKKQVLDESVEDNVGVAIPTESAAVTFACEICGKTFDTAGKVNSHMGGAHRKG